jgi:hypothetical protein
MWWINEKGGVGEKKRKKEKQGAASEIKSSEGM